VRVPGADTDVRCEVQIRTLLQDAWSTLSHTIAYKQRKEDMHHRRDALRDLSKRLDDCEKVAMALFARAVGSEHARTTSPGEKTAVDA